MSDSTPASAPRDWRDALAALPLESPPSGGWRALLARLDARAGVDLGAARTPSRRARATSGSCVARPISMASCVRRAAHRWPLWPASAAALALAIALPWRQADEAGPAPRQATAADPA